MLTSSSSSSCHFYPSLYISVNYMSKKAVPTQDVTNPVSLPSFIPSFFPSFLPPFLPFVCRIFLSSLALCNSSSCPANYLHPSPASHFKTFQAFLIYFPNCPSFSTIQSYATNVEFTSLFLKF